MEYAPKTLSYSHLKGAMKDLNTYTGLSGRPKNQSEVVSVTTNSII